MCHCLPEPTTVHLSVIAYSPLTERPAIIRRPPSRQSRTSTAQTSSKGNRR